MKHTSFEMFLCSGCEKHNTKYVVSNKENFGRCSKYVCYKVFCNVKGIPIRKWRSFKLEKDCLKQEREVVIAVYKAFIQSVIKSMV
jgi:hypothetical protein